MRTRRWLYPVLLVAVVLATATTPRDALTAARPAAVSDAVQPSDLLPGTWDAAFTLDSVWQLDGQSNRAQITGRVRFRPTSTAMPGSSGRSVYAGNFELEFSRFGIALPTTDAIGWHVGTDSVRVVFNPTLGAGSVALRGAVQESGAVIAGAWEYTSGSGGAVGRFTLRRVQGSD